MTPVPAPTVSVLMAARDASAFLREAVASVLSQTLDDLELVVVDDASSDGTAEILDAVDDPRLVRLRNDEQLGLARSLNLALDHARGDFVARLDADDVAMPRRLELQLARARSRPELGIIGSAVLELDAAGGTRRLHVMPESPVEVRWHLLFSSPFFHPSVLVDRSVLDGLRYDPDYEESEDYDLWARLLRRTEGVNLREPLVLYRVHEGQATKRRRDLQRAFQRRVALREIAAVAPDVDAELAWRFGSGEVVGRDAAAAYVDLVHRFEDRRVRAAAARVLVRAGFARDALALDPALPAEAVGRRLAGLAAVRKARKKAGRALERVDPSSGRIRVTLVSPEPTPFRSLMFDRIAERPELDFRVVYSGRTIFSRWWTILPRHRAVFLEGTRLPGVRKLLRHDYPLSFGIFRALVDARPDVVVVSGWSTFASQAAFAWCRAKHVPYVLLVESNDADPRPAWRRAVKGAVLPPFVRGAERVLAIGKLARESVLARGAPPGRVGWFANTIDLPAFDADVERLTPSRAELRAALGAGADDVVVLSIARLAAEKGLDTLVRAVAAAGDPRLLLVLVGEGSERAALEALAAELGVRLAIVENVPFDRVVERYVTADLFALLSTHEPWGVVVNEAAACRLPLVLSDRVGAHADLLVDGENGALVAAGDAEAAGAALKRFAADPEVRAAAGRRSRELMDGWDYGPSIESFVATVRAAAAR